MYTITFNIVKSSADFGKIVIEDTTAAPVGGEVSEIEITTPSGSLLTVPDIVLDVSAISSVDIPTTNGGVFLGGTYKVKITRSSTDGSAGEYEYEAEFCSLYDSADVALDVDCIRAMANVSDLTEYPSGASVTREMKVVFPPIAGEADQAPFTTTNTEETFAVTWANVSYLVYLTATASWETSLGSGVFVNEEFSINKTVDVACPSSICSIASCVNKEIERILTAASKSEGFKRLSNAEFDRFVAITAYMSQYSAFVECGNYRLANKVFESMGDLIQCDCGCDGDADGPLRIANTAGTVPVITINGDDTYIDVTENAGVYSVALDSTFSARVDLLRNSIVSSTDSSVGVTPNYDAGTNTTTYDVSVQNGATTRLTASDLNTPFNCWSSNVLDYYRAATHVAVRAVARADSALVADQEYLINSPANLISAGERPANFSTAPSIVFGREAGSSDVMQILGYAYVSTDGHVRYVANSAAAGLTSAELNIDIRYNSDDNVSDTTTGGGNIC